MNVELYKKWIEALRSGDYFQTEGTLHKDGAYCCLGVACVVAGIDPADLAYPSVCVSEVDKQLYVDLGLDSEEGLPENYNPTNALEGYCMNMNDSQHKSFSEIADFLEARLNNEQV